MKTVLLQMEDEAYEMLMKKIQIIADAEEFCLDSAELHHIAYLFLALVEKAGSLDGLTNGEMLMKMFPQLRVIQWRDSVQVMGKNHEFNNSYPLDWWNAKWGE